MPRTAVAAISLTTEVKHRGKKFRFWNLQRVQAGRSRGGRSRAGRSCSREVEWRGQWKWEMLEANSSLWACLKTRPWKVWERKRESDTDKYQRDRTTRRIIFHKTPLASVWSGRDFIIGSLLCRLGFPRSQPNPTNAIHGVHTKSCLEVVGLH